MLNTCSERFLGHIIECLSVVAGNAQAAGAAGAARATGVVLGIARFVDVTDKYSCEPRECAIARERNWVQRSA